jgi:hypothetical protein
VFLSQTILKSFSSSLFSKTALPSHFTHTPPM